VGSYHAAALSERARTLIEPGGFAPLYRLPQRFNCGFAALFSLRRRLNVTNNLANRLHGCLPHGWGNVGTPFVQTNMPLLTDTSSLKDAAQLANAADARPFTGPAAEAPRSVSSGTAARRPHQVGYNLGSRRAAVASARLGRVS